MSNPLGSVIGFIMMVRKSMIYHITTDTINSSTTSHTLLRHWLAICLSNLRFIT